MEKLIEVTELSKRFGHLVAVDRVSLAVGRGEVLGFLGPNGAGKSTTMKMITGFLSPTSGSVKVCGKELADDPLAAKRRIGYLPEGAPAYGEMTPAAFLDFIGDIRGMSASLKAARIREVVAQIHLEGVLNQSIETLSKGFKRRVGLAQAILHDPRIVFLDEPMSGLDPMGRREVRDLMEQLKNEGKTVFFSTHILSDAEALCDRVAIIHLGELRSVGAVADLTSSIEGKIELVWHGNKVPAALNALGAECHVTGDTVRAVLLEGNQEAALETLRREQLRIVSLIPVRTSLEEYFVRKLQPSKAAAGVTL